ncbi:MAG: HEAT repeat domain-containing protein [Planctomycetes bacterium]|nr:HEAT repeat domain-containing protein [Planctomycetota bacterium]
MRRTGLLFLISLLLSPLALAQSGRDVPSARPTRDPSGLDLPSPHQKEIKLSEAVATPPIEIYVSAYWGETTARAELIFVACEEIDTEGKLSSRKMRELLEELQTMGLRTRETALKALDSPHMPSVTLAARLLRSVGDMEKDDARTLIEVASGVGKVDVAGECLDAAVVIQGELPIRAVDLVAHPRRNLRAMAEGRISANPNPAFVPSLLRQLRFGREADIRNRAARLLIEYRTIEGARNGLRDAVSDESVSVAFTAVEALAGSASGEDLAYVRSQIDALETGPQLAYLVYALLLQQETSGQLLVDVELAEKLRPLIAVRDPFLSGVSAAAVAEYVFRTDVEEGLEALQRQLPLALVRAVGGSEFYPQFARFSPLAVQSLRRISGQDFTDQDRQAWAEWYATNRDSFALVRGAMSVTREDLPRLQVTWFSAGSPPRSLGGLGAETLDPKEGGRFLVAAELDALDALLRGTDVLDASVLRGTYGLPEEPIHAGLEIRVSGRRKPMRFRGAAGGDWLPQLLKGLDAQYRAQAWQVIGEGSDAQVFLAKAVAAWSRAQGAERAQLLAQWHRDRALRLNTKDFDAWASYLLENPASVEGWSIDTAQLFLSRLPEYVSAPEYARRVLDVALIGRGAADAPIFLEALMLLPDPRRAELLARSLGSLGFAAAATALADERLPIQVAATQALASTGSEAVPLLLPLLENGDALVKRAALQSLGKIADTSALPAVESLAAPGQPREIRKAAIVAMAGFGERASVSLLREAALDEDVSLRLSALAAMRDLPGGKADAAFGEILPSFVGTSLEASYAHALESRGAGLARAIYGRYLDDSNLMVRRRVAIHAGMLAEPTAVPTLMRMLPQAPNDRELLESLAHATCVDYRTMPDPAGVYEIWWRDHQRDDPSLWLVDGLEGRGFSLSENFVEGSGASREQIVGDLLELVVDGPAFLRPAAQLYLSGLTGVDRATISPGLPRAAVVEAAEVWRACLRGQ